MKVEDLFPACNDPTCPLVGQHKHPNPTQLELIHAPERFIASLGGYGSSKTLGACVLVLLLLLKVPGNRIFVGRKTYDKLHDSTLRVFLEVLHRAEQLDDGLTGVSYLENFKHFPHRIVLPNASEVVFRETKDLGRWLGPEYGAFYIDEAIEEPEETFTGLMGRLRLVRTPQHKALWRGILTSNPPNRRHWIIKHFGETPGSRSVEVMVDNEPVVITYRYIKSSTRDNPHVGREYLASLLTLSPAEVSRVVEGNLGFTPDGPAVYPQFKHATHVGMPDFRDGTVLIRGWDFGFRHPACVWAQPWRCKHGTLHLDTLYELDGQEVESEKFATSILDATKRVFPRVKPAWVLDFGDASGARRNERGPGPIIRLREPPYNLRIRYREIKDIDPGLDLIRDLLRAVCPCGLPVLTIHRQCAGLIDALAGGYHLRKDRPDDKPVKDGFYDDLADAWRYIFENFVRVELRTGGREWINEVMRTPQHLNTGTSGFGWMQPDPTQEQIAAEIARIKRMAAMVA